VAEYRFLTTWLLEAPKERVWDAIYESERWPEWWKGVLEADKLEEGDEDGLGQYGRYVWKSKRPYKLEFFVRTTRVEKPISWRAMPPGSWRGSAAGASSSGTVRRPRFMSGTCTPPASG
jgi:uncharacterized protein YndB with AHSA1/START domain